MTTTSGWSFIQWYSESREACYVRTMKSPGAILDMVEVSRPGGDMSRPAMPELVLYQDHRGGTCVSGDAGGGRFAATSEPNGLFFGAPGYDHRILVDKSHQTRCLAFPLDQWRNLLDEAAGGDFLAERLDLYRSSFQSPVVNTALRNLWTLCDDEGAPSRLLARAAGCEILAEICRMGGTPLVPSKGGLAPWAKRRCLEMMQTRLSEDMSLDELAAEARLSPFHFARMFKHSTGVPPRVYLTGLRIEKACDLLEHTDLPVTQIALEVGYSSNQVLARVFLKHRRISPTDYRRATRNPTLFSIARH